MDEFKKFDVDGNGSIDQSEWDRMALEDRRLRMQDEDAQRDAQRRDDVVRPVRDAPIPLCGYSSRCIWFNRSRQNIRINGLNLLCVCCRHSEQYSLVQTH